MTDFKGPSPMLVNARRIQFEAEADRSSFVLAVRTTDDQTIEIRFPGRFAHEFAEQAENLAARFPKARTGASGDEH